MKKTASTSLFLLILIFALFLASCCKQKNPGQTAATIFVDGGYEESNLPIEPTTDCSAESSPSKEPSIPVHADSSAEIIYEESAETEHLAKGKLVYTLNGIRIITNAEDIPPTGGFEEYRPACVYDSDGNETRFHYPEFIKADNDFEEYVRLVLLDITVTSADAKNWTIYDLDENGNPKGHYADPYVFRIDGAYWLSNTAAPGQRTFWTPDFFSALNDAKEHPFAYRLLPGESKSFSVGFLVGNNLDGSPISISDLFVRIPFGLQGSGYNKETFIAIAE